METWSYRVAVVALGVALVWTGRVGASRERERLAELGGAYAQLDHCENVRNQCTSALVDCRDEAETERVAAMACVEDLQRCDDWHAQREYAADHDF